MSRRRRGLLPEEEELWQIVARTARPLHPPRPVSHTPPPTVDQAHPRPKPPKPTPAVPEFRIGGTAKPGLLRHDLAPTLSERLSLAPLKMDRKTFQTMSRGKSAPEARLDLHGMTMAEAHPELVSFVLNAHAAGLRLILVITGKGRDRDEGGPIPTRTGALRHHVPRWLTLPPLGPVVLQIAEAHRKHGGGGALYVYLRRRG